MKITIESTLHNFLTETFTNLKEGRNYRKRKKDCGDCSCGFPVYHTNIITPTGYKAEISFGQNKKELEILITKK